MCSLNVSCTSARPLRRHIKTENGFVWSYFTSLLPECVIRSQLLSIWDSSGEILNSQVSNKTRDELQWKRCSLLPLFDSSGRLVSADRPRQWLDKISGQCGRKPVHYGWWMELFTVALWEIWGLNMALNLLVWTTSIREQKLTWTFPTENLLRIVLCFFFVLFLKIIDVFLLKKSIVKFTCCSINSEIMLKLS